MAGIDYRVLAVARNSFFWKAPDKSALQRIFENLGFDNVRRLAYSQAVAITYLTEGKKFPSGFRMLHELFLKDCDFSRPGEDVRIREEIWNYRDWLVSFFSLSLPRVEFPVFIVRESERVSGIEKELGKGYSLGGYIIPEWVQ